MAFKGETPDGGPGSLYSEEDDKLVRSMWAKGYSARDIGAKLGRTRSSVLGYVHRKEINIIQRFQAPSRPRAPLAEPLPVVGALAPQPPKRERREYDGSRPWIERASFECAFPVSGNGADVYSCCKPIKSVTGYCAAHHRVMFTRPTHTVRAPRGA